MPQCLLFWSQRPVIHSILKTVERENRGFGGHPAPEFGSTGENLHLGSRTNGPMDAEVVALFDAKVFMTYLVTIINIYR